MIEQTLLTKDDIADLKAEVEEVRDYLKFVSTRFSLPTTINITDITKITGVSRTQLKTRESYLVPYFGIKGDFPDGTKRWRWETWAAWSARPVEERKTEYDAYLDSVRKRNIKADS